MRSELERKAPKKPKEHAVEIKVADYIARSSQARDVAMNWGQK